MPKASPALTSFNAGEWSPLLGGRVDLAKYQVSCRRLENMIGLIQGPATRRAGTRFVEMVKDGGKFTRLIPFEFSTTQAYIIEFGDLYCRFYKDNGRIEDPPGTPVEIVTTYAEADLANLKFAQSADVLYITHPSYPIRTITRTSHIDWTIADLDFQDGPYLDQNTDTNKALQPSAASGNGITITAVGHTPFVSTDVGRLIRIKLSGTWGNAKIVGFTSATVVTADVKSNFGGTTAIADWRLGLWSGTTGYPSCVTFFEDRLCFAGTTDSPQRIDGSKTGDYTSFAPTDPDSTVTDEHAWAFTLNANNVNAVHWLADDEKGLVAGTVGGEWIVRPSNLGEALTPTNVLAKRSTKNGSINHQPVQADKATLFVQRAGRKLRELAYVFESDGFRAPDMSALSEHITDGGMSALAYQQEPDSIVWAVRSDGTLLGFTYERDQDVLGWHRHILGGVSDVAGTKAKVESVAVIPALDGTRDDLWLVVKRYINGTTFRYVEILTPRWSGGDQIDAFFVDGGLSYDGAPATVISGLSHLEGETVTVLSDGATHPDVLVSGGAITLASPASKVHVGLNYQSVLLPQRLEAGAADGTAQGKTKRIHKAVVRFQETLGAKVGASLSALDTVQFRSGSDPMDSPPPLFTGDKVIPWPGGYSSDGDIYIVQDQPLPMTVVAIFPQVVTQDTR